MDIVENETMEPWKSATLAGQPLVEPVTIKASAIKNSEAFAIFPIDKSAVIACDLCSKIKFSSSYWNKKNNKHFLYYLICYNVMYYVNKR